MNVFRKYGQDQALRELGIKLARSGSQIASEALHALLPAAVVGGGTYLASENPEASAGAAIGAAGLGYLAKRRINAPIERELAQILPKRDAMGAELKAHIDRLQNAQKSIDGITATTPVDARSQYISELMDASTARGKWRVNQPVFDDLDTRVVRNQQKLDDLLG